MDEAGRSNGLAVFRSIHYPGDRPYAIVFSQHVLEPLGLLFLPLMIFSLVSALQQGSLIDYLLWGFPVATAVAFLWTAFMLRRHIAEIVVSEGQVRITSVRDAARTSRQKADVLPLFDVRDYGRWMSIAAGDADVTIDRNEWPHYDQLRDTLKRQMLAGMRL